ncbi:MAG TPA: hypothetical protein VFJ47_06445 [Terriglobales bacterium]|nr:hypothetical protein [Terriglobales bacterium]
MKLIFMLFFFTTSGHAQTFSCPAGQADVMKYFVMSKEKRANHFVDGHPNPIYTQVFPDHDFAPTGYWFWLKSPKAHGFDVKAFDQDYVYMRSTELEWKDNSTFKRFNHDLPITQRCVPEGKAGEEIKVPDTTFQYYSSCRPYKSSTVGTAVFDLDAPEQMDAGGNIGTAWTRVLHYHYNCQKNYDGCRDEEQFFLANGYGLWQWKHYRQGSLLKTSLMNDFEQGRAHGKLACPESYK